MKILMHLNAAICGALLPRCSEEDAWIGLKRGCAKRAAYWMALARWCEAQGETTQFAAQEREKYEQRALAAVGESR